MTRVEKYKQYRQEIAQSSRLGQSIKNDDESVIEYTKAINKINGSILTSISNKTINFETGVVKVDVHRKQLSQDVVDLFSTLNKAAIDNQSKEIDTFFHNNEKYSILNNQNKIDQVWLEGHKDYAQLAILNNNLNDNLKEEKTFVTDLTKKYNNMSEQSNIAKINKLNEVQIKAKNAALTKVMISVCCITVIVLLALFALIIVKGVKG